MLIQIKLGRCKRESLILIDGCEVRRGVLDFAIDLSSPMPSVTLTIAPERLEVTGELGPVIARDLRSRQWRRGLASHIRCVVYSLFRSLRLARAELRQIWCEAHPLRSDEHHRY